MSRRQTKRRVRDEVHTKASVQTADAFSNALTRAGFGMPNALEATQYPLTRLTQNYQLLNSLYRSHWVVQKIINTVPQDMMKNGYDIQSDLQPDQLQEIMKTIRQTRMHAKILEGLYWGRLYGGAAGIIIIDGDGDHMEEPLELDTVMPDTFKGLLIVDRWSGVSPEGALITDISEPDFGMPEYYDIIPQNGSGALRIHHSRICRFVGREMPYLEKLAENYWGTSEIEHVMDDLKKRDNVSWNIALLTFMANIRVMKLDGMEGVLSLGNEKAQQALYATLEGMNMLLNNNGMQILGQNDGYESHQYAFSGLGEVYDRFMMDVSCAAGIPVAKLFGRSPAGMNSTGEADLQNYYDTVEQYQEAQLRPVLDKLLPVVCMSALGAVPDDLDFTFNPIRRSNETEKQDLGSQQTQAVTSAYVAGLVSHKTALQELQQSSKRTGMWTNITDEQIAAADDEVEESGEMPVPGLPTMDSDFKEEDHPRDENGKFVAGGSGDIEEENDSSAPADISAILGPEFSGYAGKAAVDKLLLEKTGYIQAAYHNETFGDIALIYGDETLGLRHIILRRKKQGFTDEKIKALLYDLDDVIATGTIEPSKTGQGTFGVFKDGKMAIISPMLHGNKLNFVLTAYKTRKKK